MSYNTYYKQRYQPTGDDMPADFPNCKHKVYPGAKFCPECGIPAGTHKLDAAIKGWIEQQREEKGDEFLYGWDTDNGACSWYDWTKHMVELSLAFPKVLFELTGWGEESGDYWRAFFLNGGYYKEEASFQTFVVNKLRKYPHT